MFTITTAPASLINISQSTRKLETASRLQHGSGNGVALHCIELQLNYNSIGFSQLRGGNAFPSSADRPALFEVFVIRIRVLENWR